MMKMDASKFESQKDLTLRYFTLINSKLTSKFCRNEVLISAA